MSHNLPFLVTVLVRIDTTRRRFRTMEQPKPARDRLNGVNTVVRQTPRVRGHTFAAIRSPAVSRWGVLDCGDLIKFLSLPPKGWTPTDKGCGSRDFFESLYLCLSALRAANAS